MIRFLIYGYFTVWSLFVVNFSLTENTDRSLQAIEVYLVPAEYSPSLFTNIEDSNPDSKYTGKYHYASVASLFEHTGNHYFINSGKPFILKNKYLSGDYSRPPPFLWKKFHLRIIFTWSNIPLTGTGVNACGTINRICSIVIKN